ncbi:MPN domain-containing protein CG4751-like isoform X2 [Atheta coriaria]
MQSQLEAALLGHGSGGTNPTGEDDDKEEHEDEHDDVEDDIDEDCDVESGHRAGRASCSNVSTSRTVTLQMLLAADVLQPAVGSMSIEYMGQRFIGDLLEDGKIRSQETDLVFASPSAWAIACKRFINPDKKSGCGWSSVKYKGRKLDVYKNIFYKKLKTEMSRRDESEDEQLPQLQAELHPPVQPQYIQRVVVKHNAIANRTFMHDANTLIECIPFSNLGKIQPFLLSISTNAALLMDFHSHLTGNEVCGYLGGHWDVNSHNLQVTHAFPCRNTKSDRENAVSVEMEIQKTIEKQRLTLVGWYHSHPFTPATPTLRDIDAQLDYQIKMKGLTDNNYTPCIGIIISPYNYDNGSLESSIIAYWVIPPPENKPNEYGRPMQMSYSVTQDASLPAPVKDELAKCAAYYRKHKELIIFTEKYLNNTTFIEKLKNTLLSKLPKDENEALWAYVRELLDCPQEADPVLTIPQVPQVTKSTCLPPLNAPVLNSGLNSNLMLTSDIANVLFNSGKFPSASSILGLPDPMAHSTLAANNMFLQTNMFKMQDILKPMSTSSPKGKETKSTTPLKIPTDLKSFTAEFYKNLQLETDTNSKNNAANVSDVADLSIISSINNSDKSETTVSLDLSKARGGDCSLDLTVSPNKTEKSNVNETGSLDTLDLSKSNRQQSTNGNEDEPMNLTATN